MRWRRGNLQVLEVATREGNVGNNLDLAIADLGDDNLVTEVADTALNLDTVVKELLESGEVEDLVAHGLRSVDGELQRYHVSIIGLFD